MKFKSPTYGEVDLRKVVELVRDYVNKDKDGEFHLIVGTDSQNFDYTKIVLVIAVLHVSKGGIFFYQVTKLPRISNIKKKLYTETSMSLECANALMEEFEKFYDETGFDYTQMMFSIHVDAGFNGKTKEVIPEIVGWVKSCGYDVDVKPNSFVASSIADKYSK